MFNWTVISILKYNHLHECINYIKQFNQKDLLTVLRYMSFFKNAHENGIINQDIIFYKHFVVIFRFNIHFGEKKRFLWFKCTVHLLPRLRNFCCYTRGSVLSKPLRPPWHCVLYVVASFSTGYLSHVLPTLKARKVQSNWPEDIPTSSPSCDS